MRALSELIDLKEPAWPLMQQWIGDASSQSTYFRLTLRPETLPVCNPSHDAKPDGGHRP